MMSKIDLSFLPIRFLILYSLRLFIKARITQAAFYSCCKSLFCLKCIRLSQKTNTSCPLWYQSEFIHSYTDGGVLFPVPQHIPDLISNLISKDPRYQRTINKEQRCCLALLNFLPQLQIYSPAATCSRWS
jgi:hypothetical protein